MRQLIGPPVEFIITHALSIVDQRRGVWRACGVRFKELMDALIKRVVYGGVIPLDQKLLPFLGGYQGQGMERRLRIGDKARQQGEKMPIQARNGGRCKQAGVIIPGGDQLLALFFNLEHKIEFGR